MLEKHCPRCGQFLQSGKSCNCYVKDLYAKINYAVLYANPPAVRKSEKMEIELSSGDRPDEDQKEDGEASNNIREPWQTPRLIPVPCRCYDLLENGEPQSGKKD